jgi:hypothetical protein
MSQLNRAMWVSSLVPTMFKELLLKRINTLEAKMSLSEQDRIDLENLRDQLIKLSAYDFGETQSADLRSSVQISK